MSVTGETPTAHDLLLALFERQAFDPLPLRTGLHSYHVPFDEIVGPPDTEAALIRTIRAGSRVAVTGPSGAGKSSLISYVLSELSAEVAVLRVPVEAEDVKTITDPAAFAAHMLFELMRQADRAGRLTARERAAAVSAASPVVTTELRRANRVGLGLPTWLLRADLAAEAQSVLTTSRPQGLAASVEALSHLVGLLAARGLPPVVLIDDSDAWLQTSVGDRSRLVVPFFGRVLRDLVEELICAWIVTVHDHYLTRADFPRESGVLQSQVAVPVLPDVDALGRILEARVKAAAGPTVALNEVFEAATLPLLFDEYRRGRGNIRTPIHLAHAALEAACGDDADIVTRVHAEVALTRFQPPT